VGKLKIVKNWLAKFRRTGHLAFLPDFSAIVGGFPSKYSSPVVVTAKSESQTAYNRNLGGLSGYSRQKYCGNPRLPAGLAGLLTARIEQLNGLKNSLDKLVSPPHKTSWETRPPYFHEDCFHNLQELYDPRFPKEYRDGSGNGWVPYP
jgi:hypothetical protein